MESGGHTAESVAAMEDREDAKGYGYLGHELRAPETDAAVAQAANELGVDHESLFAWANGKTGRYFMDSHGPRRQCQDDYGRRERGATVTDPWCGASAALHEDQCPDCGSSTGPPMIEVRAGQRDPTPQDEEARALLRSHGLDAQGPVKQYEDVPYRRDLLVGHLKEAIPKGLKELDEEKIHDWCPEHGVTRNECQWSHHLDDPLERESSTSWGDDGTDEQHLFDDLGHDKGESPPNVDSDKWDLFAHLWERHPGETRFDPDTKPEDPWDWETGQLSALHEDAHSEQHLEAGGLLYDAPAGEVQEYLDRNRKRSNSIRDLQPAALHELAGGGFRFEAAQPDLTPPGRWMVPYPGHEVRFAKGRVTPQAVAEFVRQRADSLSQDNAHLAAWHDGGDGVWLDVTQSARDRLQAERYANNWGQRAIFDVTDGISLPVGELAQSEGMGGGAKTSEKLRDPEGMPLFCDVCGENMGTESYHWAPDATMAGATVPVHDRCVGAKTSGDVLRPAFGISTCGQCGSEIEWDPEAEAWIDEADSMLCGGENQPHVPIRKSHEYHRQHVHDPDTPSVVVFPRGVYDYSNEDQDWCVEHEALREGALDECSNYESGDEPCDFRPASDFKQSSFPASPCSCGHEGPRHERSAGPCSDCNCGKYRPAPRHASADEVPDVKEHGHAGVPAKFYMGAKDGECKECGKPIVNDRGIWKHATSDEEERKRHHSWLGYGRAYGYGGFWPWGCTGGLAGDAIVHDGQDCPVHEGAAQGAPADAAGSRHDARCRRGVRWRRGLRRRRRRWRRRRYHGLDDRLARA